MRGTVASGPRRAATTWLCASCRKQAGSRAPFSLVATVRPTPPHPTRTAFPRKQIPTPAPRRWISHTQSVSSSSSSSSSRPTETTPITPPSTETHPRLEYYTLFPSTLPHGPPPSGPFAVDVKSLRREFLRLQAAAHPDFHHQAGSSSPEGAAARRNAEAASALINAAFKTLASPLLRAEYLLREQHGVDLAGDERGEFSEADPEVLMTVLEAREAIEEADSEEDLEEVRRANESRIGESEEVLGRAFEEGDVEAAKGEAVRLRYWMNIRESLDNWERGEPVVLQH